jgi:hypothetical protein
MRASVSCVVCWWDQGCMTTPLINKYSLLSKFTNKREILRYAQNDNDCGLFFFPLEPGEGAQENSGRSVSCLSGVKRSELNATRIFLASERTLQGGVMGCIFFGYFLWACKESNQNQYMNGFALTHPSPCPSPSRGEGTRIFLASERTCRAGSRGAFSLGSFLLTQTIPGLRPTGAREVRPIRLSCRIVAPKERNNKKVLQ